MQVVRGLSNYQAEEGLHLALGNFDGVHRGHQMLVRQAVAGSRRGGGRSAVFIFEPHPLKVLAPKLAPKMLVSLERKLELFSVLGIEQVIISEFNREVALWSPRYFIEEILCRMLQVAGVYVGFNYNFGHKGAGTPEMLSRVGQEMGFGVKVIPPVKIDGTVVSSTIIRNCLEAGDVTLARTLLGYTPGLTGTVVRGEERGRTLGFPTANVRVDPDILLPLTGVYAAMVRLRGRLYPAVLNIGKKPTFHPDFPITVEAHLPGYQGDFYGEEVDVLLVERLRPETRFDNRESLIDQINQDILQALQSLNRWIPSRLDRH